MADKAAHPAERLWRILDELEDSISDQFAG